MSVNGKYISLVELKLYGLGAIADPNNPTVYNKSVQGLPDDSVLSDCIARAEMEFDRISGIQFDEVTSTNVQGFLPYVNGNGWLNIFAREHAPITAVSAISILDMRSSSGLWTSMAFDSDYLILPLNDGYAHPDSARVQVRPTNSMNACGTGEILVKWTYTGGFSTIPQSLKAVVERLAWWVYKIREAPMYQIAMPQMGIMQIPLRIPPDIDADLRLWQPVYN